MTSDLLNGLIRANLAGGAAIVLVLILRGSPRRAFGAGWTYGLWALPPLVAAASLLPFPQGQAWYAVPIVISPSLGWTPVPAQGAGEAGRALIAVVWALGALALATVLAARQVRFTAALGELRALTIGGRRVLRSARTGLGPAVVGRSIVVPADFEQRFTPDEQQAILAHETTHLVRGDVAANALTALVQCLCWFNPLVHLAAFQARLDQELACDAAVIAARPALRRAYAEALLKTQIMTSAPPLGCTWPSRAAHPLKERISMLRLPAPTRLRRGFGAALLVALSLGGGYAAWAAQAGSGHVITNPEWEQRPRGEDMKQFYPPEAEKRRLAGETTLQCRVELSGALTACKVLRQSPKGAGFGEAGLKLTTLFRMKPMSQDGTPVAGGIVRIPIAFRLAPKTAG